MRLQAHGKYSALISNLPFNIHGNVNFLLLPIFFEKKTHKGFNCNVIMIFYFVFMK